jgi:hypothetical protein
MLSTSSLKSNQIDYNQTSISISGYIVGVQAGSLPPMTNNPDASGNIYMIATSSPGNVRTILRMSRSGTITPIVVNPPADLRLNGITVLPNGNVYCLTSHPTLLTMVVWLLGAYTGTPASTLGTAVLFPSTNANNGHFGFVVNSTGTTAYLWSFDQQVSRYTGWPSSTVRTLIGPVYNSYSGGGVTLNSDENLFCAQESGVTFVNATSPYTSNALSSATLPDNTAGGRAPTNDGRNFVIMKGQQLTKVTTAGVAFVFPSATVGATTQGVCVDPITRDVFILDTVSSVVKYTAKY